jgi:hypothetical protein
MSKAKFTPKEVTKVKVSRDAGTGQFVPKKYAESHPKTTVTETIKKKKI